MPRRRFTALALGFAAFSAGVAPNAMAASKPETRLVSCGAGNCLLISGHRDHAASEVRINGHAVPVEGGKGWKVRLPVDTVRAWSAPLARAVDIALLDPETGTQATVQARLPIGLLGHVTDLAMLEIRSP
ncbi:hypothetical protein WBP06_18805 [Novosphingobium sp. BL-8H]|uniref:hypothetical protein n=1 Tax=Novosphingobium sp. BL-8H TaxID=3127640 RepID=UPI0037572D71